MNIDEKGWGPSPPFRVNLIRSMDIEAFVLAGSRYYGTGPRPSEGKPRKPNPISLLLTLIAGELKTENQAEECHEVKYYSWGKGGVRANTPGAEITYQTKGTQKGSAADRGKDLAEWPANLYRISTMLCCVLNGQGFSLRTKQITGSFIHDAHHCCLGTNPSY